MEELPIKKRILFFLTEYLLLGILWLIFLTCKKSYNDNKLPPYPCEVLFWHNRLAFMCFAYKKWWKSERKRDGKVIISDHKDGELITRIVSHFGIGAVRGSSTKGAIKALKGAFSEINNGIDIIITPDGPKGPIYSVADGAVVIAQKKDLEIYTLTYEASRYWEFNSWDKMRLPKPFSRVNFILSKPFKVNDMELEVAKEKIKNELFKAENDNKF